MSKPNLDLQVDFKSKSQELAWNLARHVDVLFLIGTAGSGKSFLATALAVDAVNSGHCEHVVITRPIVEAGENLGFLPGDVKEKVAEYTFPIRDALEDLIGKDARGSFMAKHVKNAPLAFIQGRTFKESICIFDEAQNATYEQLKTYLSRLGLGSKMIVTADPSQPYIENSGLMRVIDKLSGLKEVGVVQFEHVDVVRHRTVAKMLRRLD